jgi:hypothetical protein
MGSHVNISHDRMPRQGSYAGTRAVVIFDYDSRYQHLATAVRDDAEAPGVMIFRLDDGRHVLSTECQWSPGGQHRD